MRHSIPSTVGEEMRRGGESVGEGGSNGGQHRLLDTLSDSVIHADHKRSYSGIPLHLRVLVVDDSDLNRRVVRRAVERLSAEYVHKNVVFTVEDCDDGVSACDSVTRASESLSPYDLVLMDNIMVHMNGPEAAKQMRDAGYSGYIAGVTGNVLAKDVRHFEQSGADCVLAKPLNLKRLKDIVNQAVERASV